MGTFTLGWRVDRGCRDRLMAVLPPRYAEPVADHVTLQSGLPGDTSPPKPVACRIVGQADDGEGVQAMVVEIDGSTARPDGGTYHITWSLAEGREAVESNDVIRRHGWSVVDPPLDVDLEPARFPR